MTEEEYKGRKDIEDSIREALSVSVKIPHEEIHRLVVSDILRKRIACRDEGIKAALDTVLTSFYLSPDELKESLRQLST